MATRPAKLPRPDINLEAILALIGVLLGFLFIVVIYILEYSHEFLTMWGIPLIMYIAVCYAIGLSIIALIISHEINFYLANKTLEINPEEFPEAEFAKLLLNTQRTLRQTIRMLLFFVFSFGLFLINLASFTVAKLFYSSFAPLENLILIFWGPIALLLIRLLAMFVIQLVLIIPFAKFQGDLWASYRAVETIQSNRTVATN
ncbi:MAG: hypothetical protein ACFFD8_01680 [Candidatus Thorarchaeota archaeon]